MCVCSFYTHQNVDAAKPLNSRRNGALDGRLVAHIHFNRQTATANSLDLSSRRVNCAGQRGMRLRRFGGDHNIRAIGG